MKYDFYSDPFHGWLKVPISELEKLKITDKISSCSYMKNGFAYLEEDGDLSAFLHAKNIFSWPKDMIRTNRQAQNTSKIRAYDSFDFRAYNLQIKISKIYDENPEFRKWTNAVLNDESGTSHFSNITKFDEMSKNAQSWFFTKIETLQNRIILCIQNRIILFGDAGKKIIFCCRNNSRI